MKFKIKDVEVMIFLGVPAEEREKKQKVLINLSFYYDTQIVEKSDKIEDTIDYFQLYECIQGFAGEREFFLVEHFYDQLFNEISKKFPQIEKLKLKIKKFPFTSGSVSISR